MKLERDYRKDELLETLWRLSEGHELTVTYGQEVNVWKLAEPFLNED